MADNFVKCSVKLAIVWSAQFPSVISSFVFTCTCTCVHVHVHVHVYISFTINRVLVVVHHLMTCLRSANCGTLK